MRAGWQKLIKYSLNYRDDVSTFKTLDEVS